MKKIFGAITLLSVLAVLTMLFAACGGSPATGPNQVQMNDSNFAQSSLTIKKGASITLVNAVSAVHVIENGTWDNNGNAKPLSEDGAPKVDANIGGNAFETFGPFNTMGTFHLYCTIHPGMNLTITVQ